MENRRYHLALTVSLTNIEKQTKSTSFPTSAPRHFQISRQARLLYKFEEQLFTIRGNMIFPNFTAVREFAQRINDKRDLILYPEKAVKAGEINAMGLIDEIFHFAVDQFKQQQNADVWQQALEKLDKELGAREIDKILLKYVEDFPPPSVIRQEKTAEEYLQGESNGTPNREIALEEMLLVWVNNQNPAYQPYRELFDDFYLDRESEYTRFLKELHTFFEEQPAFGPDKQNFIDFLRSPAIEVPHEIPGQLEYIRKKWGLILGKFLYRLLSSLDLIKEEAKADLFGGGGPGATRVFEFGTGKGDGEAEAERFSPDKDWMPRVVLLAKSTYVWLDQLSRTYQQDIHRLDQIPDEELARLSRWGFTGLWLIGLWERSKASKRIKQMCGNPEAEASAYSLYDYRIADELGGEEAYQNLKRRAWQHGVRLCGDMVPNHMSIDSRWVVEHPDWFISLAHKPYPSHSFNGPNLSGREDVGIYLEDHYFSRTDAAVEFLRVDHNNGDTRYIYHGNDGTSMPWNDTAQLNYLKPEVREAVIQTILEVARKFPIIRFDAAMTLAKKHFQRLWYPEPGSGGDIPTRAEHSMTRQEFDQAIPEEFWREVVDRVAAEAPDTLLLAEAFWLMEGYFVRTLGMHRVYNSAFMHMLKNEENAKYRASIKNVLEFNPEILKRFVNFMNNPDEETAVKQFGKDDKYFGVTTMMITMPGLPMFGHGQIEGFSEKYGMEYRRAYWNEISDENLIQRHEREIFPLMHKRYLFADVENFYLYDFYTPSGQVEENVFCYSNRHGKERGLVVYHNRYDHTAGWVRTSVAFSAKQAGSEERSLQQRQLGEGLALQNSDSHFIIFREALSGLEFIRNCREVHEKGLYMELGAYQRQVFLNFREVADNEWRHYANLAAYLDGRGVPSMDEALQEIFLQPIHQAFRTIYNPENLKTLWQKWGKTAELKGEKTAEDNGVKEQILQVLEEIRSFGNGGGNPQEIAGHISSDVKSLFMLPNIKKELNCPDKAGLQNAVEFMTAENQKKQFWTLLSWTLTHRLGAVRSGENVAQNSRSGLDEWLLTRLMLDTLQQLDLSPDEAGWQILLIKILIRHQDWWETEEKEMAPYVVLRGFLQDPEVQSWLRVNRYRSVLWFNNEAMETLLQGLFATAVIEIVAADDSTEETCGRISACWKIIEQLRKSKEKSDYQVEKLLEAARNGEEPTVGKKQPAAEASAAKTKTDKT
ncbi:MAG: alpha-amylase family glycosyl hydrolase [Calditrichia bacterium]